MTQILTEQVQDVTHAAGVCVKDEKGQKKQERFDAVIVATGGLSYERTGSTGDGLQFARDLGLQVTECQPSLVPFEIEEDFCRNLMGLSLRNVTLSCYTKKKNKDKLLYQEQGEMLFTHFGISGPLVLSASAYTGKAKGEPIWVEIDLKPALTIEPVSYTHLVLLLATNPLSLSDGVFEVTSAIATVGLSRDVTPGLNVIGKVIIIVCMYLGRVRCV